MTDYDKSLYTEYLKRMNEKELEAETQTVREQARIIDGEYINPHAPLLLLFCNKEKEARKEKRAG